MGFSTNDGCAGVPASNVTTPLSLRGAAARPAAESSEGCAEECLLSAAVGTNTVARAGGGDAREGPVAGLSWTVEGVARWWGCSGWAAVGDTGLLGATGAGAPNGTALDDVGCLCLRRRVRVTVTAAEESLF